MHPVASVVVSRWREPACLTERFRTLPRPAYVLTDAVRGLPPYARVARPVTNLSHLAGMRGKTSKDAKKAFVFWLAHSAHVGAWHFEDDVVARNWTRVLGALGVPSSSDLAAPEVFLGNGFYLKSCSLCQQYRTNAMVAWPVLYMSRRFARRVYELMLRGEKGHHEVFTVAACRAAGCRWEKLHLPGVRLVAKWVSAASPLNEVMHPKKCHPSTG